MSAAFHVDHGRRRTSRRFSLWWLLLIIPLIFAVIAAASTYTWYNANLQPLSSSEDEILVTIQAGTSASDIGKQLEQAGVIKSAAAFDWYTRLNDNRNNLQAGGYKFMPSMSVEEIVEFLVAGQVASDLVTILPAQRLDQVRMAFADAGYSTDEIRRALDTDNYIGHPALQGKPLAANLEGYLYPESYKRELDTPLTDIIKNALDETAIKLTPERIAAYEAQGLSKFEAVTLASIIEREVSNPEDRTKVAQVFLSRYQQGIMLGSDPTALYGALKAGIEPSVRADTPYNTRLYVGLPPGPINNISEDSLEALANPADTDYLFFVSGDDGNTYFSRTVEEHEALTAQHCIELCQSY